jgi:hypothetical protein
MGGSGVIDQYQNVFTTYIDSGFGLLGGDVRFLSQTLIALDITLAGLFWARAGEEDVIARIIKKTLTRLRSGQLPNPTARQLPGLSATIWMEPSSTGDARHRGALNGESYRLATSKKTQP